MCHNVRLLTFLVGGGLSLCRVFISSSGFDICCFSQAPFWERTTCCIKVPHFTFHVQRSFVCLSVFIHEFGLTRVIEQYGSHLGIGYEGDTMGQI